MEKMNGFNIQALNCTDDTQYKSVFYQDPVEIYIYTLKPGYLFTSPYDGHLMLVRVEKGFGQLLYNRFEYRLEPGALYVFQKGQIFEINNDCSIDLKFNVTYFSY